MLSLADKKPATQPILGAELTAPLQKQIREALVELGPMTHLHLLGLLFAQTKDLNGQQRLRFKTHRLWGKCLSKIHPRTPQEVSKTISWLKENGFVLSDTQIGCLRFWNQPTDPLSSVAQPSSMFYGVSLFQLIFSVCAIVRVLNQLPHFSARTCSS